MRYWQIHIKGVPSWTYRRAAAIRGNKRPTHHLIGKALIASSYSGTEQIAAHAELGMNKNLLSTRSWVFCISPRKGIFQRLCGWNNLDAGWGRPNSRVTNRQMGEMPDSCEKVATRFSPAKLLQKPFLLKVSTDKIRKFLWFR
jgi:hypothetical protein